MKKEYILKTMLAALILCCSIGVWADYNGQGRFEKVSVLDSLENGAYYVLYGINSTYVGAMKDTFDASGRMGLAPVSVVNNMIHNPQENIVWKLEADGSNWRLYSESAGKYCEITGNTTSSFTLNDTAQTSYTVTVSSGNFFFCSNSASAGSRGISIFQQEFRSYAAGNNVKTLNLYKMVSVTDTTSTTDPWVGTDVGSAGLTFGPIPYTTSETQSFYLEGKNLTGDIYVKCNDSYEFTVTPDTITPVNGAVADTIYVTYLPQAAGMASGTVYITGGGLSEDVYISVNGESTRPSLDTPSAEDATDITHSSFTANWGAVSGASEYELYVWTGTIALTENFNDQRSTGGNDNQWSGSGIANTAMTIEDWTLTRAYAGDHCMKMGTSNALGVATTPILNEIGNFTLKFRAGSWDGDSTHMRLKITGGATLSYDGGTAADSKIGRAHV